MAVVGECHRYDAERQNSKMQVDRRKRSSGSPMRKSGKIASAASSPLSSQTDASASASSSSQSLKTTKKEARQSKKSVPSLKEMSEKNNSAAKAEKERKARDTEWQKTMGPALALLVSARRLAHELLLSFSECIYPFKPMGCGIFSAR